MSDSAQESEREITASRPGRPTKLTSEVERLILEALRGGNTRAAAAEYAGIHRSQFFRWMDRFATFRDAVIRAEAGAEVKAVTTLHEAYADGDWRAALAWLERRRHEDWGRRDKVEIVNSVRELARREGWEAAEEEAAVAEVVRLMQEQRGASR